MENDVFNESPAVATECEAHRETATNNLVAVLLELQHRRTQEFCLAIVDELVEHVIAFGSKAVAYRLVRFLSDGKLYLLHSVKIRRHLAVVHSSRCSRGSGSTHHSGRCRVNISCHSLHFLVLCQFHLSRTEGHRSGVVKHITQFAVIVSLILADILGMDVEL